MRAGTLYDRLTIIPLVGLLVTITERSELLNYYLLTLSPDTRLYSDCTLPYSTATPWSGHVTAAMIKSV